MSWGTVARARRPIHGRCSYVTHDSRGLFERIPSPIRVGRHSLIIELDQSCEPRLMVTARSEEGEIMALAHRNQPTYGVQFHPESILAEEGDGVLRNFLQLAKCF
ncbi:gamma-glutamyl-gamma-aminobutyrate hydrolase family protein [Bradyrhizobium sp. CSA207]|uniref:glutamine amidotransferase-related protein n=1 Tax=Bradyrhizobium sp. CSA207 TaxID=2698826 RepID=UPI003182C350